MPTSDRAGPPLPLWFDPARSDPAHGGAPRPAGTAARPAEPLTRERIVTAAMALADAEPHGGITMRALAGRLGVRSPMALYRYVGSKDGLADLMADEVYRRITVTRGRGWREALRGLGLSGWTAVQRHPWFARLAFARPPFGPGALGLYDAALAELEPLDLDAAARMGAISTVLGHVLGAGLALLEENAMRAGAGVRDESDLAAAAAPLLARIAESGQYPHFSRWAADPARDEPAPQSFERILEWLLDGLATSGTEASGASSTEASSTEASGTDGPGAG